MPQDLSRKHHLIGTLFTWPRSEAEWQAFELSADQVSFYQQNGYLAGIKLLNDEQVAALCTEVDELTNTHHPGRELFYEYHSNESTDPNTVLFHALGAWRVTPGLHDVLWNPAFVMAAAQLLQAPVRFWHDQIFYKPARHGGVVAWHQDFSYWTRTRPMAHLSCWIGLDDSTIENGCVQYVPRSHQWELLPITGLANDMNSIQSVLSERQQNEFQPVPIELKKGEASFHHPLMVHGSFENKTEKPRRAIVINAFADGVLSDSNEPLLAGVPPIPRGERMQGQFFPLLFDPAS
jgi:ectoine hydroxylase-related dioxygenase (phytanoyl-CoA dioxygenase family)